MLAGCVHSFTGRRGLLFFLSEQQKARHEALEDHVKDDHLDIRKRLPDSKDLALIVADSEFDVTVGNDSIDGGAGGDLILGDNVSFVVPFAADDPTDPLSLRQTKFDPKKLFKNFRLTLHDTKLNKKLALLANDGIEGDDGNDILLGQQGKDTILGGNGEDQLFGGKDKDTLDGGAGVNIIKQGGEDNPKKTIAQIIQDATFESLDPLLQQFLLDVAATEGVLGASGEFYFIGL